MRGACWAKLRAGTRDVDRITIKQSQAQLTLAKKGDVWAVQERGDYPANYETISEALRKVWGLKVAQPVEVGASSLHWRQSASNP